MDSASWRLVLRVAQDYPQALVVLTSRPVTDVRELRALSALEGYAELKLSPLRSSAIGSLVESVLGGQGVAEDVLEEITQRSAGNPLFAREYALLLTTRLHQGDFPSRPAAPQPAPSSLAVPVTVQSLIASRLDALSPSEDLALKAASVLGDTFNAGLLGGVYPGSPQSDALDAILANLTERQLIVRAEGDAGRFGFQHALIREVAYQQLTRDQRIELHRRAAAAIEAEHHGDLRPHFAVLAHHWSQAEEPAATITYSDRAASQALAAGAFEEANRLLSACIRRSDERALDNAADRIRWHRQMADARHGMGQLEPRSAAAHQALRIAGAPRPQTSVGLVLHSLACLGRLTAGRIIGVRLRDDDARRALDIARAYRHSAEVCYFNNDMLGMLCDSVSAVTAAASQGPSAVLAGASTELGGILSIAGLRRAGERILQRAIAVAEAADDQAAQAYAHMVSCLYYVGIGDWHSAEKSAQRCQALCEPLDDRVAWTNAQAVRFWMSHYVRTRLRRSMPLAACAIAPPKPAIGSTGRGRSASWRSARSGPVNRTRRWRTCRRDSNVSARPPRSTSASRRWASWRSRS